MSFKILFSLIILALLAGCNLRENETLPSGISPFDLLDKATYIKGIGSFSTSNPNVYVKVTVEEPEDFAFIDESYNFSPTSHSYYIKLVNEAGHDIVSGEFLALVAFPTEQFTFLGLKHSGDYKRFYPYPSSDSINGFGAFYQHESCYFVLSDSGYYQTVSEQQPHSSVTVEINPALDIDINVSLYQAQFILPRNLIPPGVKRVRLEKLESVHIAEYDLTLSNLPVNFDMIQNNPDAEKYPILYIPLPPETDMSAISVTQIKPNNQEVNFHYDELLEEDDQFAIYGNCIILLINDQGKFIINEL